MRIKLKTTIQVGHVENIVGEGTTLSVADGEVSEQEAKSLVLLGYAEEVESKVESPVENKKAK